MPFILAGCQDINPTFVKAETTTYTSFSNAMNAIFAVVREKERVTYNNITWRPWRLTMTSRLHGQIVKECRAIYKCKRVETDKQTHGDVSDRTKRFWKSASRRTGKNLAQLLSVSFEHRGNPSVSGYTPWKTHWMQRMSIGFQSPSLAVGVDLNQGTQSGVATKRIRSSTFSYTDHICSISWVLF